MHCPVPRGELPFCLPTSRQQTSICRQSMSSPAKVGACSGLQCIANHFAGDFTCLPSV